MQTIASDHGVDDAFARRVRAAQAKSRELIEAYSSVREQCHAARHEIHQTRQRCQEARMHTVAPRPPMPAVTVERPQLGIATEVAALRAEVANLERALETRDLVWTAKALICKQAQCTPEEAHQLLVHQSQHQNRKLVAIAQEIVAAHST